jgi:hypothetical protein
VYSPADADEISINPSSSLPSPIILSMPNLLFFLADPPTSLPPSASPPALPPPGVDPPPPALASPDRLIASFNPLSPSPSVPNNLSRNDTIRSIVS